ncbi:MAG: hypothetical protein QM688_01985 [Sphingomonas bacterium]
MTRTLYIFDQGLKGLVGHYYEYVRSIVEAAQAQGIRCVVGCHEEAGDGAFASFELHSVFRDDVWATMPGEDYHSAASMHGVSARFLEDIDRIIKKHPIHPGDIVFLPNVAKPHVVATALVAETFGPLGVHTQLMFRYPASHFEGDTAASAFRRLEAAARLHDVSLCTDSHRLAENLAPLSAEPFVVFPIPHTWHGKAGSDQPTNPERPLHCVSLGNARDEKGMAEILEAVRLSAGESWSNRVRFTLQVNDPYQVEEAIEAFRRGPADHRTVLIDRPLSSVEYAELLDSADVVLVPYWRSIYRERTSGVFLEGLTTGKLVLCTRDTWMSDLFDLHGGGVAVEDRSGRAIRDGLRDLVEQRELLQERARQAAQHWQAVHSPRNLVAHLTRENARAVFQRAEKKGKAAVIFPWGEAVSGKTGASLLLKYFVRYMETIYDEVRVLFTGGSEPAGIIGERTPAEPVHYSEETKKLHETLKDLCLQIGAPEEHCFHLWFHLWPSLDNHFALCCEEMVAWADHIYVNYTYFIPIIDGLCQKYNKEYTVTLHDIVSDQCAGTPFLHQATRALEFDAVKLAPRVVCISKSDLDTMQGAGVQAELIPPVIDALEASSPFSREEARAVLADLYDLPAGGKLCFFVGSSYAPNAEAAEVIAAMARQCQNDPRFADVMFVVAGGCMLPRRTDNFAALGMIENAALSACMALADIVLVPLLKGTGVSLKSVEGLARGSLLLSTSLGMRNLDVQDGVHCRIEDDISMFPDRIAEILADDTGSQHMREAARAFGEQFDYRRLMALYLPGSEPVGEIAESQAEFATRREAAIRELLPRMRKAKGLSPLLADWLHSHAEDRAVGTSKADSLPADHATSGRDDASNPVPEAFDPTWYLSNYPDVAMLGMDPAEHYAWIGRKLGRAASGGSFQKKKSLTTG